MPISITLRRNRDFSPFKRQLEKVITAPGGDSIVLCSDYIWQPDENRGILQDGLLPVILAGCKSGCLTTVAGKLDGDWLPHYRNFVSQLRKQGLTVSAYVAPRHNWHAKIAIRQCGSTPIAALLGSSNSTHPAYSEGRSNWNFECNVTLWRPTKQLITHFRRERANEQFSIESILDPSVHQPDESSRLEEIQGDILDQRETFEEF